MELVSGQHTSERRTRRWSTERSGEWERLDPKLVCEVAYDYFSQGRFRHGTSHHGDTETRRQINLPVSVPPW